MNILLKHIERNDSTAEIILLVYKKVYEIGYKKTPVIKPEFSIQLNTSRLIFYFPPNTFFKRSEVLAAGLLRIFASSTPILSKRANNVLSAT